MSIHPMTRLFRDDHESVVPEWTVGDRLRKSLDYSRISVAEMARIHDVGPATISRWMHDKGPVKQSTLIIWAAATGVDLAWLETGTAGLEDQAGRDLYASRDLNPEPADSKVRHLRAVPAGVNRGLTVNRILGGTRPTPPPDPSQGPERATLRLVEVAS